MLRVLLVDDFRKDLEILSEAFEHRGAEVTAAASDSAAYRALENDSRGFDLLVTDVDLGAGTTGFDVARAARQYLPGLPVVYMTAFDISMGRHAVPHSLALRKPVRLADIADAALDFFAREAGDEDAAGSTLGG